MKSSIDEAFVTVNVKLTSRPGIHNLILEVDTGAQGNTLPLTTFRRSPTLPVTSSSQSTTAPPFPALGPGASHASTNSQRGRIPNSTSLLSKVQLSLAYPQARASRS